MESKKYSLITEDFRKVGIGLLIALGGAALTYLQDTIPGVDFGQYQPIVMAVNSIIVNAGRKYLTENTYDKTEETS